VTTPNPPSFARDFKALRARVRTLEATRRGVTASPTLYFSDNTGNVVVSADGVAPMGLGRPYLPIPFVLSYGMLDTATGWPTSTSATFVDVMYAAHQVQHAYVLVNIDVVCASTAAAEVQVLDDSTPIGDVAVVDVGDTNSVQVLAPLVSIYSSVTTLRVQLRRASGTGAVWAQVAGAWGVQTPV
jgi:hypothetical protein